MSDYSDLTLEQLFKEADRIGSKYQNGEIDPMTTKQSVISYHASSNGLNDLIESRGDRLLELSGIEKLQLIAAIAGWQAEDTEAEEACGDPRTIDEFIDDSSIEFTGDVLDCLSHLSDCSIDDLMALIIAIGHQVKEGAYLQ
ncbi:MAG: hypothetical protein KME18_19215 [Phormidium tanganyikae FI6-MK23]|jgi:hypothetical protein|nr:hypothetical protein [Phormidium tanganyikae FI6-MK23]